MLEGWICERISEELSSTVKSSYFEKGAVQWIVCIEKKKKSVCLKYAIVVLLLYDALNLTDNFLALLWWSLLLRVTAWPPQGLFRNPLPAQTLSGAGEVTWRTDDADFSPPLCSIFKLKCKNEYSTFCLLSIRKVASSLRPLCLPGRGTLSSPMLSFPPLGIIANPPDPWALLSYLPLSGALQCVVTLLCKVIYTSLYNCSKETEREGPRGDWLVSGWWKGWNFFPTKLIKSKQNAVTAA